MTMSRRHWAAVVTTLMMVVVVAMLLQYSRAMALRYSGLSEPPARPLSPFFNFQFSIFNSAKISRPA